MFNVDKRILYIIIAIFAVSTIVQYIQNPMELLALLLTIPGVIVAITFHEFAHAFVYLPDLKPNSGSWTKDLLCL